MKNLLSLLFILFLNISYAQNLKDSLGRKQGRWIEKIKGKKVESHYKDGLLHGEQTVFQKRKNVNQKQYFKNGILDSIVVEYVASSDQLIKEMGFKNGLLHGYYRVYWGNGKILIEVSFENGTPNTDFKFCSSDGLLMSKYILHPSKLFFFIQVGYHEDSVFFQCFTYQDPLYFIDVSSIIGSVKINSIFSKDVVKWMKSKKTFRQRRKMAEKLYDFKVQCK
jgi:hypothetical protein